MSTIPSKGLLFGQPVDGGPFAGEHAYSPKDKVVWGPGCAAGLPGEVDRLGGTKALIVTGNTLANKTDLVAQLEQQLGDRCGGVFSRSVAHPTQESVLAAAEQAREIGADILISFGGGSPIDTAKAVSMCLANDVNDSETLSTLHMRVEDGAIVVPEMAPTGLPHIALPTTCSAGEHSMFAGVTDPVRKAKDAYGAPPMTPRVVFLDPELCRATPDWLWASTGVRAIDHCIESVYSVAHSPFADALALKALEILVEAVPRGAADPDDTTARGACLVAAWMSIFSLPNVPYGLSHAIGHQLGARCGIPHGVNSAIMLPVAMDYNRPVTAARQALLAEPMGVDTSGLDDEAAAAAAAARLRELVSELGIKARLSDWGVTEADIPATAQDAFEDFMLGTNPRPIESPAVIEELLRSVL